MNVKGSVGAPSTGHAMHLHILAQYSNTVAELWLFSGLPASFLLKESLNTKSNVFNPAVEQCKLRSNSVAHRSQSFS